MAHPTPPDPHPTVHVPTTHIPSSPWLQLPKDRVICVEHPAAIRNLDNAVATIGGQEALQKLAASNGTSGLHLRFRPQDYMQPPIESRTVNTNNVLLKITIPRRRKKNRHPHHHGPDSPGKTENWDQKTLLGKLRASKGNFKIEPVGTIERTIRFRDIANFQWNTSRSHFLRKAQNTLLKCDYESIVNFQINSGRATGPGTDIFPPPAISGTAIQHTYNYRQNPAVKKALIDGQASLYNLQAAPKTLTETVHILDPDVPMRPPDGLDYDKLDAVGKECVDHIRRLFQQRPIWTRRGLYNHIPNHVKSVVRFHMVYVAYMWRAGPWRDTCVVYGLDPRKDPSYRNFQSLQFQMNTSKYRQLGGEDNRTSHIFDGEHLVLDGRVFQLCDVTDPLLQPLINTDSIRKTCDPMDGWYRASTIRKMKAVMRKKIINMIKLQPIKNSDYVSILEQESENEEQEAERKARDEAERQKKREKKEAKKRGNVAHQHPVRTDDAENDDVEDEDVEVEDDENADGEWQEELDVGPNGNIDGRVQQLMKEYMDQGDQGFDMEEDDKEGDFDILGEDDDDDEADDV